MTYVEEIGPGRGARRAARSWLHTDAPTLSLAGQWRFRLLAGVPGQPGAGGVLPPGESPEDMAAEGFDDAGWDGIRVPAHWVLEGDGRYGRPIYTNVQFPFPLDPPHVPDDNPTGDYRRGFELPDSWSAAAAVVLRFDGVESRYRVWVNGVEIGVGTGSRLPQEFDVTAAVRPGANTIAVRVHQWSADSYVEDQDQWWLPGIFREVTLQARPVGGIEDVWVRAGFAADGTGCLVPEVTAAPDAYPVTLRVPELGIETRWDGPQDVQPVAAGQVEPWSAEVPRLYEVTVASAAESVSLRVGFRTVRIEAGRFLVNDRKVVFHGVNRHESHPDHGRVFDAEVARADLMLMKRFNVNAIRTSHYPPHPQFLDLADELGFWVILECDVETHGFEREGWAGNPSDDPAWRSVFLDRIERTVERDKNHPSIVMWSLANESGTGQNLAAMAAWVQARDPERPVHYEGDHAGAYTDVYSRMYAPVPEVAAIGSDGSRSLLLGCTAPESARQRTKPFLLCEYAHAMGNGPGALDQYEDLVWRHARLHGGFIWEWRDHGLRAHDAAGTEFFAYGGDFGEGVHDGNFVMDGLALTDSAPTPGLFEYKQVAAPVRLAVLPGAERAAAVGAQPEGSGLRVVVTNRRHTADTGDLEFRWRVELDGEPVQRGVLDALPVPAGATVSVPLPSIDVAHHTATASGELWLTVEAVLGHDVPWAPAGHPVVFTQHDLTPPAPHDDKRFRISRRPGAEPAQVGAAWTDARPARHGRRPVVDHVVLGPAEFEHGHLTRLVGLPTTGPRLELWRAPTDNDRLDSQGSYERVDPWVDNGAGLPAPPHADVWRAAGLDRLGARVEQIAHDEGRLLVRRRWSAANERAGVVTAEEWRLLDDGLWLHVDMLPSTGWDMVWPRVGVRFDLPGNVDGATWFGTGPLESYPDSRSAARVGRFTASLDELNVGYSRPQETGHRSDLRWLAVAVDGEPWLHLDAAADSQGRRPGFTLTPYTAQQLDRARHPHELTRTDTTHLYLDAAQCGLGSRSCGPDVWPDFLLRPQARTLSIRFRAAQA
ncbi:glycoside hydrolase family 2 TIM barrel-domain containing protein [Intrasporangium sp.]|uniref:glycoside hydrolase family 2 TIM barrel-domain containing protein n=1 Tax=Intrasporangium sp. TaxID=1925024 RepID=UPI003221D8CD